MRHRIIVDEIASERTDERGQARFQADAVVDSRIVDEAMNRAIFVKRLRYRALAGVIVAEFDVEASRLWLSRSERALEIRRERAAKTTGIAPSRASPRLTAAPMPDPPPVTMTTLSLRTRSIERPFRSATLKPSDEFVIAQEILATRRGFRDGLFFLFGLMWRNLFPAIAN
jgi:hypothetical protein